MLVNCMAELERDRVPVCRAGMKQAKKSNGLMTERFRRFSQQVEEARVTRVAREGYRLVHRKMSCNSWNPCKNDLGFDTSSAGQNPTKGVAVIVPPSQPKLLRSPGRVLDSNCTCLSSSTWSLKEPPKVGS